MNSVIAYFAQDDLLKWFPVATKNVSFSMGTIGFSHMLIIYLKSKHSPQWYIRKLVLLIIIRKILTTNNQVVTSKYTKNISYRAFVSRTLFSLKINFKSFPIPLVFHTFILLNKKS